MSPRMGMVTITLGQLERLLRIPSGAIQYSRLTPTNRFPQGIEVVMQFPEGSPHGCHVPDCGEIPRVVIEGLEAAGLELPGTGAGI